MAADPVRARRGLTLALLAVAAAAGVWWLLHIPYDPQAIYRPVPASASLVGRHLALPSRWEELLDNPLALAMMRTAGADPEAAGELTADEETRAWFEKLAGREGVLAYLPGRRGAPPAWMAVSHLGGDSQKLRWQLTLFRVPGFTRMKEFPGRSVWRVESPDLDPAQHLVIAFGEGVLMACLSENPFSVAEVLGAYDGTVRRLLEEEISFGRFAEEDRREVPDRLWLRDESGLASEEAPGLVVEIPVLNEESISLTVATEGVLPVPRAAARGADAGALARRLGGAPCAVAAVPRETVEGVLAMEGVPADVRFALRMVLEAAGEQVAMVFLDGELGGRLAWGAMRTLGLSGLRVPTVLVATPVSDLATAGAAIQRVLDRSNARHRAAFVLRPVTQEGVTLQVLESAGGDEWVDALARSDRPAYGVVDGWLLASSNLAALQKLAGKPGEGGADGYPGWADVLTGEGAGAAWLDLARSGKVVRDAIATWSMAQMFLGGNSQELREQLNALRAWVDAFAPLGEARARLEGRKPGAVLALDLGLSASRGSARIGAP